MNLKKIEIKLTELVAPSNNFAKWSSMNGPVPSSLSCNFIVNKFFFRGNLSGPFEFMEPTGIQIPLINLNLKTTVGYFEKISFKLRIFLGQDGIHQVF